MSLFLSIAILNLIVFITFITLSIVLHKRFSDLLEDFLSLKRQVRETNSRTHFYVPKSGKSVGVPDVLKLLIDRAGIELEAEYIPSHEGKVVVKILETSGI